MHDCPQPYIREEDLDREISALLTPFALREDWAEQMLARVKEEKHACAQSSQAMAAQKRSEIAQINLRLQRLLDSMLDGIVERDVYVAEKGKLMSQRKSLEEQSSALQAGHNGWLEPFTKWIISAKNAGKTAVSGSLTEKRALAKEVFGSNLILDRKKARGSCAKPWSLLLQNSSCLSMVRVAGLEPARLSPLPPQSSVSANSTTRATGLLINQARPPGASHFRSGPERG